MQQKEDFGFRRPVSVYLGQAPYIASELFVGRGYELDAISRILHHDHKAQRQQRLVLGGMGGIGKTQIAIAYAESGRGSYSSVFWLNAVSEAALKDSFRSIASIIFDVEEPGVLEDKEIVRRVHQWLCTPKNTAWLLIFDNYDDSNQFNIDQYYPPASHGAVVVTTRRPDLVAGSTLHIEPFRNIKDSLAILQTRSKREDVESGNYVNNKYILDPLTTIVRSPRKAPRGAPRGSSSCFSHHWDLSSAECLYLRTLSARVRETLEH